MRAKKGLWPALDALPSGAAVSIVWKRELGNEFDAAKTFLTLTTKLAAYYPCTDDPPCECRMHRVIAPLREVATCACGCIAIRVEKQDIAIWKLNGYALARAIRAQFAAANLVNGVDATSLSEIVRNPHQLSHWQVAGRRPFEPAVIICFPVDANDLLRIVDTLQVPLVDRFLLLTPTRVHYTTAFEIAIRRRGCLALPLNEFFQFRPNLKLIGATELGMTFAELRKAAESPAKSSGEHLSEAAKPAKPAAQTHVKRANPDSAPASGEHGRLRWENDFEDIWLGANHFDLRDRNPARYCIKFLVGRSAFDKQSARHLVDEIDPYVRERARLYELRDPEGLRIHRYFKDDTGKLQLLRDELVKSAGRNGRFFLHVK